MEHTCSHWRQGLRQKVRQEGYLQLLKVREKTRSETGSISAAVWEIRNKTGSETRSIPAGVREMSNETGSELRKAYLQVLEVLLTGLCSCSLGSTA